MVLMRTAALAASLVALTACATPATPTASDPLPPANAEAPPMSDPNPPMPAERCDADTAKPNAIGQVATAEVVERARIEANAEIARVLKPGTMVTMEYRAGRLNIDVDEANVITNVRCG